MVSTVPLLQPQWALDATSYLLLGLALGSQQLVIAAADQARVATAGAGIVVGTVVLLRPSAQKPARA